MGKAGRKMGTYVLDAALLVQTTERLHTRIEARFPGTGLSMVCAGLIDTAKRTIKRARTLSHPFIPTRLLAPVVVVLWLGALYYIGQRLDLHNLFKGEFYDFAQALESVVNLSLLIFAATWFVWNYGVRVRRRQIFRELHELRSFAHVIDMHQLTKDPDRWTRAADADTPSSPRRTMTRHQLARYLDYCSELLALDAKLAALYAQSFDDAVVLAAVDEVETLASDLSGKIWQKLVILNDLPAPGASPPFPA